MESSVLTPYYYHRATLASKAGSASKQEEPSFFDPEFQAEALDFTEVRNRQKSQKKRKNSF